MIFIIWTVFWLTIACLKLKQWINRKKTCSEKICVQVVEILSKRAPRGSGLVYKPIFKVYSIKNEIIIDSAFYTSLYTFVMGQVLWIYVNPENIQEFMYESPYNVEQLADVFGCVLPLIAMILFILFAKVK